MATIHPRWSTWTFLVYTGGLTGLAALGAWLSYFASHSSEAAYVGWTLVLLAAAGAVAVGFRRTGHPVAAGVFAFVAVIAFVAFVNALWTWFGWQTNTTVSGLDGFHLAQLFLELLWLVAAIVAVRSFRFPLIVVQAVLAGWLLVTDLLSNGGDWSAVVTLVVGLSYLSVALAVDTGPSRPYGFWLHVGAGALIGGSLLWFWHGGDVEWTLVAIAAVLYVLFAQVVGRSSWAVLGVLGLGLAATHFTLEWTHVQVVFFTGGSGHSRAWVPPLVVTCLGALFVALGLRAARRGDQVGPELA